MAFSSNRKMSPPRRLIFELWRVLLRLDLFFSTDTICWKCPATGQESISLDT